MSKRKKPKALPGHSHIHEGMSRFYEGYMNWGNLITKDNHTQPRISIVYGDIPPANKVDEKYVDSKSEVEGKLQEIEQTLEERSCEGPLVVIDSLGAETQRKTNGK